MPKGHKRKKNPGVGIDFRKAKHKVGRKLPKAQNETDTTVKSQKLVLAEQSVGVDKTGLATTSRNNTLKELLSQCGHYSEKVRLKALNGLIDLLKEYPLEAKHHASEIVATTSAMASDSSVQCRDAYCSLLRSALFPAIGDRALQPFIPYLMGHICSAMTHLSHGIRTSGIDMMNVVLEWRPDVVGQQYFSDICQHFIEALGKSSRGRSLSAGSLKNLVSLVEGCHTFLKLTLWHTRLEHGCEDMSDLGTKQIPFAPRSSNILLQWKKCYWDPSRTGKSSGKDSSDNASTRQAEQATKLLEVLLECWEECGLISSESAPRKESESLICGSHILKCCTLLVSRYKSGILLHESHKSANAERIFTRVFPYFPSLQIDEGPLLDINGLSADLISMVIFELHGSGYQVENDVHTAHAIETLAAWCCQCFERSSSDPSAFSRGIKISKNTLSFLTSSVRNALLSQLVQAWLALPVEDDDRNKGIKFMYEIFKPPLIYYSMSHGKREDKRQERMIVNPDSDEILSRWISEVPSLLWKIRKSTAREYTFRQSFLALLNVSRYVSIDPRTSRMLPNITKELEDLTMKIIPLFAIKMNGKVVPGPLSKMPQDVQSIAVDVLYQLPGLHKSIIGLLYDCVEKKGMFPADTMGRLFEVVYFKSQYGDPEQVWGLIYAIMQGSHIESFENLMNCQENWNYENLLLNRISRIALHCSPPALALQSVLPSLLDDSKMPPEANLRSLYGALYFLHECLLLNEGRTLDVPRDVLDKTAALVAILPGSARPLAAATIADDIDKLAQETTTLLISQSENFMESVMKYIGSSTSDNVGCLDVLLSHLLKALDRLEYDARAMEHLKSIYPNFKDTIDQVKRQKKCPENIQSLSNQLMIMFKTALH